MHNDLIIFDSFASYLELILEIIWFIMVAICVEKYFLYRIMGGTIMKVLVLFASHRIGNDGIYAYL